MSYMFLETNILQTRKTETECMKKGCVQVNNLEQRNSMVFPVHVQLGW